MMVMLLVFRLYLLNGVKDWLFLLFWWPLFIFFVIADVLSALGELEKREKRKHLIDLIERQNREYDRRTGKEDRVSERIPVKGNASEEHEQI